MIEAHALTKRYGATLAVDDLTFTVRPGAVTGFLGPNGAGKSTTMRMVLGLDRPSAGRASVNGKPFAEHRAPLREVGAVLDARSAHPGRRARHHLLALAQTHALSRARVDEVIDLVGLHDVAHRRVGGFSLGMAQRLGIAAALLGDPATLVLDEPANGLDPEGIRWMRDLLSRLAAEGRTVFVSSHLMSEMALVAQRLIVIGRGQLIADTSVEEFTATVAPLRVRVVSPNPTGLCQLLTDPHVDVAHPELGVLEVTGMRGEQIGRIAAAGGVAIYELTEHRASLEDAFLALTCDAVEYPSAATTPIGDPS